MRALVIDDEPRLAANIAGSLWEGFGLHADVALDGERGWALVNAPTPEPYDLVVLDLMLPKLGGPELLRRLRASGRRMPVLVLSARDDKPTIVELLDSGADDYMPKPFDLGELLARAKALIRRSQTAPAAELCRGTLELNQLQRRVRRAGQEIVLTPMEYRVLEYLALNAGRVVPKAEMLAHLYDFSGDKFTNVVEVYVSALRRKVDGPFAAKMLFTERGRGYALRADVPGNGAPPHDAARPK
ncbi:MAG TPA: response regulator transcription factor [Terriglobales bacterium]|nr:response regulator transcription factor [Terriglobales bacterium]